MKIEDYDKQEWIAGENEENNYWYRGSIEIIQLKGDLRQIFRVEWHNGKGEKGVPLYMGHYPTVEDAKNDTNCRELRRNCRTDSAPFGKKKKKGVNI